MELPTTATVQSAFVTPLLRCQWPDSEALNASLLATIATKRATTPGVTRSLSGGWHSALDLFEWNTEAVATLAGQIFECFTRITRESVTVAGNFAGSVEMSGWANVTVDGGYNRIHNHADSMWSGVYYAATGSPDPAFPDAGVLEFVDPRLGANMVSAPGRPFGGNLRVVPAAGLMVLFPSWLLHFVNPFRGTGERVSISFNLTLATGS